ncbi:MULTISPECIES: PnuC protein [Curvivirga]|uniref:PnuC protein n=1 Tax=Curvivirga TaxID=2856846 RepID=UPI0012BB9C53|nr:PnuC protein [Curvivirga aplysinae]MTI09555.1 PnuC protein [Curvivirga aplysinae]
MEQLFTHYGVDWVAMTLSVLGAYMLGNKNQYGFIVFAISNVMWIFLGLTWMTSIGMAIGNLVFCLINLRGYWNWRQQKLANA